LAVEIKYWDKGAWISYLKDDILPFYESLLAMLNLWKELKETAHGKFLSDVIKDAPNLELVFAAGTSPPDKYEEEGLALVYKSLFGTNIKLREYYFLKSLGKEPKTICAVEKTAVVNYLDHMSVLVERILSRASELELITQAELQNIQEESRKVVQVVLANPESVSERFTEFLNRALRLTVAYNEYTRFIWHLRKIPKKYVMEFYPELLKPNAFKFIQELLGLSEYIVPQVEDPEIVDMYTMFSFDYATKVTEPTRTGYSTLDGREVNVYTYFKGGLPPTYDPYKTIGGCMCRVNELIWGLFSDYPTSEYLKLVVSEVPNPFKEWQSAVASEPPTRSEVNYPNCYEDLSVLDECLPSIFTGMAELVKGEGRILYIFRRW